MQVPGHIEAPQNVATASGRRKSSAGLILFAGLLAGCSQPFAATSNRTLVESERDQKLLLDSSDQARIKSAFGEVAAGHQPVDAPGSAELGLRWTDVPLAVAYACDDVEMAVTRTDKAELSYQFHLVTIEGAPGVLTVNRTSDERVYDASATIGLIESQPAREQELIDAIERQMRAFGKKRSLRRE